MNRDGETSLRCRSNVSTARTKHPRSSLRPVAPPPDRHASNSVGRSLEAETIESYYRLLHARVHLALLCDFRQSPEDVEEAMQDAFVSLSGQNEPPQNVAGWLISVARHRLIDRHRQHRIRQRHHEVLFEASARRSILARYRMNVEERELADAVLQLRPPLSAIVSLKTWGEWSFDEIARELELSSSTVHRRYAEALEQLRRLLEPEPTRDDICPQGPRPDGEGVAIANQPFHKQRPPS